MFSLGIFIAIPILFDGENLRRYNPWAIVSGTAFIDRHNRLIVGPVPWLQLGCMMIMAIFLGFQAMLSIERKEV